MGVKGAGSGTNVGGTAKPLDVGGTVVISLISAVVKGPGKNVGGPAKPLGVGRAALISSGT